MEQMPKHQGTAITEATACDDESWTTEAHPSIVMGCRVAGQSYSNLFGYYLKASEAFMEEGPQQMDSIPRPAKHAKL